MVDYVEKLLILLVENYRKSRKDSGTNTIVRRTQISPDKLYRNYKKNDADLEQIEAVNHAVEKCREKGFLTFEMNGFSNEISKIYLLDEKITEIEQYLTEKYQYESKHVKRQYIEQMLLKYSGHSPAADGECEKLCQALDKNQIPRDYLQTEQILKALVFIENNQKLLYLREASMLIYGESKYFEENTLENVCRILREHQNQPCGEDELQDEILEEYHIVREKQKLCIKGDFSVKVSGKILDFGVFGDGIEFFSDELNRIEKIEIRAREFMTVENRTAYFRCKRPKTVYFYLGGYVSRFQREFLKKIFQDNKELCFRHFGDIDAGGFYIYEHLCRMTGIPFGMYKMSVEELQNPLFQSCLQKLTANDRRRLESLAQTKQFREVAEYMLKQNVKLEQEIVCYLEGCDERAEIE